MIKRPISEIACQIQEDWIKPHPAAEPYLEAMRYLGSITDSYGADSARSIIAYFLANASTWRGQKAREIKKELNLLIK